MSEGKSKQVNEVVLIRDVRIAFAQGVFEASSFEGGKKQYSAKFLIEPGSKQAVELEKIKTKLAKEKWGPQAEKIMAKAESNDKDRLLKDGDLVTWNGFEGMYYVSANNDQRPTAYDRQRAPVVKSDGVIYSGCYVNARVELWAQDNKWGKAIRATLLGVQFVREGDAFVGGSRPAEADDFPELDAGDEDDPFA